MSEKTGQCLCGANKYQIRIENPYVVACHCRMCQRMSGGPFQIWVRCPISDFTSLEANLYDYRSSNEVIRQSCAFCTSHLYYNYVDLPSEIWVTASSLDMPNVPPNKHIWFESKIEWLTLDDGIPTRER